MSNYLIKLKKLGVNITLLTSSIVLVACGGGGSEGYFNNDNSNSSGNSGSETPSTPEQTKDLYANFKASKTAMLLSGDTLVLTTQVLNSETGGAAADEPVTLQLVNAKELGISIDGLAEQTTDSNGYAIYTLKLNASTNQALLRDGISINLLNAEKKKISDIHINIVESEVERPLYDLAIQTNKNLLSVKGDTATITVKALDTNGGSLVGKTVTLSILDYTNNRVLIDGPSTQITDELGNAIFIVRLPLSTGELATSLMAKGISLEAKITDPKNVTVIKPLKLNVIAGETLTPVGNITFGNAGVLTTNNEKTFYSEDISAQVVDIDGKPLANQKVTMSINIVSGALGRYVLSSELETLRATDILNIDIYKIRPLKAKLNELNTSLTSLNGQLALIDETDPDAKTKKTALQSQINSLNIEIQKINNEISGIEADKTFIARYVIEPRTYLLCSASPSPSSTSLATSLVDRSKVDDSAVNEFSYTTSAAGSFDFKINYLRRYAGWQTVQIKASTTVSGKTVESIMFYPLNPLKSDLEADVSQPFDISPYGPGRCSYQKPWANLL
ncbi:Ig-like domain-containing protein [Acinetobacter radioresistens]|uniref:Ig-like domain-containing protein n=1 Tax=Acinetobacter radioresistens TaxID=40216 RepID=UPI00125F4DCE|nr:Ig-like domain-containing protein [Acinetobacter radioresistens]